MTATPQRVVRLAWGIAILCLAGLVACLVLLALDLPAMDSVFTAQLPWLLNLVVTGVLGLLIATRLPRNPIGWLLLAISVGNVGSVLSDFIAVRGMLAGASPRSWVEWPTWVFSWSGGFGADLLAFLILLFPHGRLPSPRWRWAAWSAGVICAGLTLLSMVDSPPVQVSPRLPSVPYPVSVPALASIADGPLSVIAIIVLLGLVAASVVVRLRRATGVERKQLRWFAYVAAAAIGLTVLGFVLLPVSRDLGSTVSGAAFDLGIGVALPLTIGLAVIKDGLYDIDLFLSRAVVYGTLAAFITAVYVGIAVGIGALVGSQGRPNLGLSIIATAIVAIGFQPVRERVQRFANRLVYGQRATPYEVLSQFSSRVAETYAADQVLPRMARVLQEGTGAESATVWLRSGHLLRPAATFPESADGLLPLEVSGEGLPEIPAADHAVAVEHQGELLGALSVAKRRGESLTPMEEKLVDDLAHQAGLVLRNVGLTSELLQRLEELRVSRQRLVRAQDQERRRLERNLHDGAQQHLVALKVKLGLVGALSEKNAEQAQAMLEQLQGDADEALETLRDLARGIYPPLLADRGLGVALESQAQKATLPVAVEADGVGRYPAEVEATVYFCVLEALQNVQKYAGATRAVVRLGEAEGELRFEVEDDGGGFEVSAARNGTGLTNMADRLDAVGGRLHVGSAPGRGTRVSGSLPAIPGDGIPRRR